MPTHPAEPFRSKVGESIELIDRYQRTAALQRAGSNAFAQRAQKVFADLPADSGMGAISQAKWAAIMEGDGSCAGTRSYFRLVEAMGDIFGFQHFVPPARAARP